MIFYLVCHGDDLIYIFNPMFKPWTLNEEDEFIRKMMTTAWTNFAKNGDPALSEFGSTWNPSTKTNNYFDISGKDSTMTSNEEIEKRMAVWDELLKKVVVSEKSEL